ncbi:MAG: cupin domain-containing protein [Chitinivibrionales bacterium]|nr:cupin domain-containing protein [Chitinivibrionales bacterium]
MNSGKPYSVQESIDYAEGSVISKTLLKKKTGSITLFSFDTGQGLSEHTSPFEAVVQVTEGTAQISINREAQTVSAGEMIILPANIPHALHAEERFKMMLIMIRSNDEK